MANALFAARVAAITKALEFCADAGVPDCLDVAEAGQACLASLESDWTVMLSLLPPKDCKYVLVTDPLVAQLQAAPSDPVTVRIVGIDGARFEFVATSLTRDDPIRESLRLNGLAQLVGREDVSLLGTAHGFVILSSESFPSIIGEEPGLRATLDALNTALDTTSQPPAPPAGSSHGEEITQ